MTYREMSKILMDELRLYHSPIAVHFFDTDEKIEEFKSKAKYLEPVKPMTYCQWEIAARMQNKTVLAFEKDLGCSNALVSFGWRDIDENEIKSHKKYCVDLEQAERFLRTKPRLGLGFLKGIAVAPLADAVMPPDVVHFYCDNMQSYHLANDYMASTNTHPLRPAVLMNSSACGGSVFCFLQQDFNMCPACSGSYNAGKTERGEVNVFIPGTKIEGVVNRLLQRIDRGGSSSITRPGDAFPGGDICKNCPLIIFKPGKPSDADCQHCKQ